LGLYNIKHVALLLECSKDIVDHYYSYLSCEMDSDVIVQQKSSQELFCDDDLQTIATAMNTYQKNCLMLEKIRLMDIVLLENFCKLLKTTGQPHLGTSLLNGESQVYHAVLYCAL